MLNKYNELMDKCSMCHDQCVSSCPMFTVKRTTTVYPGRKVYLARCLAKDEIECDESLANSLYQCFGCRLCKTFCVYGIKGKPMDPVSLFYAARHEIIKKGIKSENLKIAEGCINEFGNLYGDVSKSLSKVKAINVTGRDIGIIYLVDAEVLTLNPEAPMAAVKIMNKKGIKPIISDIFETGYDFYALGFFDKAMSFAKKIANYLNNSSAKKLVISSPKTYYALTEWFKEIGIEIKKEVFLETDFFHDLFIIHFSEYKKSAHDLQNFIKKDKLVVYHDGSYMARYLKNYDIPRMLIKPLFSRYQELRTNKEDAKPVAPAIYPVGISEMLLKKLAKLRIDDIECIKPDYVITSDAQSYAALKKYWDTKKVISIPEALLMNYVEMDK